MAFHHWFIPHKQTHKKAHLLSWEGLLIYILLFILLQVSFSIINYTKPGVLGISGNLDQKRLIELTNRERDKAGLPPVVENEALSKAAQLKAANMFAENYWAHFAPSGKTPWDFILGSGYKFSYAGENLAKNFQNSEDVVVAWMNSKTHRDNLLNPKYKDIGIVVAEGVLNGQKTILVVQEFGTTEAINPRPVVDVQGKQIEISKQEYNSKPELLAAVPTLSFNARSIADPYLIYKSLAIGVISFMGVLLALDVLILYRRGVFRLSSHHIAHMAILSITAAGVLTASPGSIL